MIYFWTESYWCKLSSILTLYFFVVRLGSKHNVRASILASSLCLDSASLRGGSIKSGFTGVGLSTHISGRHSSPHSVHRTGPPSLVLHSSSGVSSGSTTSSDNGDAGTNGVPQEPKPDSPTPSSSSVNTVVKRVSPPSTSSPPHTKTGPTSLSGCVANSNSRGTPRPRHLKQRKEVFKSSMSG